MPSFREALEKKRERNQALSHLPPFTSMNEFVVYGVNRWTDSLVLFDLMCLAQNTTHFTIDTESDVHTNRPSLIQVEMIHRSKSTVVLVEVGHLPRDRISAKFWWIKGVLKFIFEANKTVYTWGKIEDELMPFVSTGLFTEEMIKEVKSVDVQFEFKSWFNRTQTLDPMGTKRWGLQTAIRETFNQFLDKSETFNTWSRGLFNYHSQHRNEQKIEAMINYAVNDCLAVTKLANRIKVLEVSVLKFDLRTIRVDETINFLFHSSSTIDWNIVCFSSCFFSSSIHQNFDLSRSLDNFINKRFHHALLLFHTIFLKKRLISSLVLVNNSERVKL